MNKIITLSMVSIIVAIIVGCTSPAEKVGVAQENVIEANKKLSDANSEYLADITKYKKETKITIAENEKSIAEFNLRVLKEKKQARVDYEAKIKALNQKNTDLKKKLDDYKATGKEDWESFKKEFNHDMDELGKAFKNFSINNVK